jgi:hypothetical protein
MSRGLRAEPDEVSLEAEEPAIDAITVLDNVVRLDQMLDERSRVELGQLPYLELSKHLKIKRVG